MDFGINIRNLAKSREITSDILSFNQCRHVQSYYIVNIWEENKANDVGSRVSADDSTPSDLTYLPLNKMAATFADDIFNCICMGEKFCFSILISLKFVPRGPIDNEAILVQAMAWRRRCDKPLPELMPTQFMTHICGTRGKWVNKLFFKWAEKSITGRMKKSERWPPRPVT